MTFDYLLVILFADRSLHRRICFVVERFYDNFHAIYIRTNYVPLFTR